MWVPLSLETIWPFKILQYVLLFCFRRKKMLLNLSQRICTTSTNSMVFPPRIEGQARYQRCAVCWEYVRRMPVSSAKFCNPLRQKRKVGQRIFNFRGNGGTYHGTQNGEKLSQRMISNIIKAEEFQNFKVWTFGVSEPCIYWWKSEWHLLLRLSHKLDSWG